MPEILTAIGLRRGEKANHAMPVILSLARARTIVPDWLYWLLFALIVVAAVGFRAFWTYALQVPFTNEDSQSYLQPAILDWPFLFSEFRTMGTPMLNFASLAVFGHPAGILVTHNLTAVGSSILLALAIRGVLRQNLLSLAALFVTAFTAKDIAVEYHLISEHDARALYVVYAALVLWLAQNPSRYWLAALLGLVVALNVMVKPDAIVLVVATMMTFGALWWISSDARAKTAAAAAVFLIASVAPLLGSMAAFKVRYGTFGLSHYEGTNQFSHVGHLTVLDGGKYPELKARLRPLLEGYVEKYARHGIYFPNWLIYGTATEDLARDFGDQSPHRVIDEYVKARDGTSNFKSRNEIHRDLAIEAMLVHPIPYAKYAAERAAGLWSGGYTFAFYDDVPKAEAFKTRHPADRAGLRVWLYRAFGQDPPPCAAGEVAPARASGVPAAVFRGPLGSCAALPYNDPAVIVVAANLDAFYAHLVTPLAAVYPMLPKAGALAAVAAAGLLIWLGGTRVRALVGFGALLVLVLFGYSALHGIINVASPVRMTANVQDYVIIASLTFMVGFGLGVQRLLRWIAVSRAIARVRQSVLVARV